MTRKGSEVQILYRPPLVNQGPGGILFKEAEGAFPLVGPYVTVLHVEVPKYCCEHLVLDGVIGRTYRSQGVSENAVIRSPVTARSTT